MFLKRKIVLAQTQEEFDKQAEDFLIRNSFPNNDHYKRMYGQFIQMLPESRDWFYEKDLVLALKMSKAKHLAFFLIEPGRRPKKEEAPSEQEATPEADPALVQKASE